MKSKPARKTLSWSIKTEDCVLHFGDIFLYLMVISAHSSLLVFDGYFSTQQLLRKEQKLKEEAAGFKGAIQCKFHFYSPSIRSHA